MSYPFPSFGSFNFQRDETADWEGDVGWIPSPSYGRSRALGTNKDILTTFSIGSFERTIEVNLSWDRYQIILSLLNSYAVFTDWRRPTPESKPAFLSEVVPIRDVLVSKDLCGAQGMFKKRTRLTFISQ